MSSQRRATSLLFMMVLLAPLVLAASNPNTKSALLFADPDSKNVASPETICPNQSQCPGTDTCCPNNSGGYGCCPYASATCCPDGVHCCPNGLVCDENSLTCTQPTLILNLCATCDNPDACVAFQAGYNYTVDYMNYNFQCMCGNNADYSNLAFSYKTVYVQPHAADNYNVNGVDFCVVLGDDVTYCDHFYQLDYSCSNMVPFIDMTYNGQDYNNLHFYYLST
eukprot:TRINITY_DN9729_c0_g1_i1.p1 TRINITY_DN9729_c0_g1~~TRINITY_DN9729_c0_g1_i1.p1  ORF type:complete len:223 (+),score=22.58 TRINITY_DN9729_c0_g1_i1:178-846(+)